MLEHASGFWHNFTSLQCEWRQLYLINAAGWNLVDQCCLSFSSHHQNAYMWPTCSSPVLGYWPVTSTWSVEAATQLPTGAKWVKCKGQISWQWQMSCNIAGVAWVLNFKVTRVAAVVEAAPKDVVGTHFGELFGKIVLQHLSQFKLFSGQNVSSISQSGVQFYTSAVQQHNWITDTYIMIRKNPPHCFLVWNGGSSLISHGIWLWFSLFFLQIKNKKANKIKKNKDDTKRKNRCVRPSSQKHATDLLD